MNSQQQGKNYRILRLNVCNPKIVALGLAEELIDWAKVLKVDLIAWQNQLDKNWMYIFTQQIRQPTYPLAMGKETNDYTIPIGAFVAFPNQSESWMIDLVWRNRRATKTAKQ